MPAAASPHFPLRGLRVLEWCDSIAAHYAARLLADAGADVVKIEPPAGDSARREGPFPGDLPDPAGSGLFAYLNRGKRAIVLDAAVPSERDTLRRLVALSDVLVHDYRSLAESPLQVSAESLLAVSPRLIAVSVTPFGQTGPRAAHRADDLIVVSAAGLAFSTPGFPDHVESAEAEPPLRVGTDLGEFASGLVAATATTLALVRREQTGVGELVEVSKQEAVASMLVRELGMWSYGGVVGGRLPARTLLSPNHYLPVADGWAVVVAFSDKHWHALVGLMGSPEWAEDPRFATAALRGAHWSGLEPLLLHWLREQPGKALLEQTQRHGIPCAPALSIAEAVENEQVAARRFLVPSGLPGDLRGRLPGDVTVIDGERRSTQTKVPRLGVDTEAVLQRWLGDQARPPRSRVNPAAQDVAGDDRLPLAGVRIVDFGQMVAVPVATYWLATMGAEVIVVESRAHPLSRQFPPFAGEPSPDTSSIFNHVNRNKRSCTLNLRTPEGLDLALRLIAAADVVTENFSPGTMDKLGLGYQRLRQLKPDLIVISLSGCGSSGPWSSFSALHSGVILLSGLAAVTGYARGHPRMVGSVFPDPLSGAVCALAVALAIFHRRRTGQGQHVELAMTEVLQSVIPQAILEYTMLGREAQRIGNRHRWKAPHGVYRAGGEDRWLAISVSNEEEWRALCQVTDRPGLASDRRFASAEARRANAAELEAIITAWTVEQVAEDAAERLQHAGVPATLVYDPRDVLNDEHLRQRGFIRADDHPRAGTRLMPALPWRFHNGPAPSYRHAPLLGADNDYVFRGLLGLSAEEMRDLERRKVIH